jgi:hypothetical protein
VGSTLAPTSAPDKTTALTALGFLTVLHEASGYVGGYLTTNVWGRPLEFRLSSAVQPNRVQQILYAATLEPYVCADLIGKTLVEKTGVAVQLIVTDTAAVLDLRHKLDAAVVWLTPAGHEPAGAAVVGPGPTGRGPIVCHPGFPQDVETVRGMLAQLGGSVDVSEPFVRIREAIGEARKLGVSNR